MTVKGPSGRADQKGVSGALRTRPADPSEPGIRAVLSRNLPDAATPERISWLYGSNPCGPALVWLAETEGSGEPVATSAAHRRTFRIDGREALALNLSDFAIDAGYRTLGPALGLLRATLAAVAEGGFAMSYDVPSESMLALYKRLGYVELGRMERRVRPLSLGPALRRRIGGIACVVAPALDLCLRVRDALASTPGDVRVAPLEGAFGAEFDALEAREATRHRVRGARTAAYLDWRYARHTMWKHGVLSARRGGALVGFAVWREAGSAFGIAELVDGGDLGVARALVKGLAAVGRRRGATALSVETLAGSPASERFESLGFLRRGDGPGPVVYVPPGSALPADAVAARHWWFLGGDRDI
ncbi:MAG TPA: GNAT family N-acetyltransferase [Planctomycetota bacterium]|nr:GNAT family N-acetyltransferase [Planctomycetota bacterium]